MRVPDKIVEIHIAPSQPQAIDLNIIKCTPLNFMDGVKFMKFNTYRSRAVGADVLENHVLDMPALLMKAPRDLDADVFKVHIVYDCPASVVIRVNRFESKWSQATFQIRSGSAQN